MRVMARQRPLGDLIAEARETKGLSQKELAEQAGVAPSTVQALEYGSFEKPQKRTLRKVGAVLGLDLDDPENDRGPYADLISRMDEDIQRTLAMLGSWLAGQDIARRRRSVVELLDFMHRDDAEDGPTPRSVHSGPPAPH